jgi:hypothetical protein
MSVGIVIPADLPCDEHRTSSHELPPSMPGGAPFHAWQVGLPYNEVRAAGLAGLAVDRPHSGALVPMRFYGRDLRVRPHESRSGAACGSDPCVRQQIHCLSFTQKGTKSPTVDHTLPHKRCVEPYVVGVTTFDPFSSKGPDEVPLERAPLARVIAQVRFPTIVSLGRPEFIGPFQEAIRPRYPILRSEQAAGLTVGPLGSASATGSALRCCEEIPCPEAARGTRRRTSRPCAHREGHAHRVGAPQGLQTEVMPCPALVPTIPTRSG